MVRPRASRGVPAPLFFAVIGYALLATAVAVYALVFKTGAPDTGHPLSTIPDNFGEFDPATRRKVSQYKFPVDGPLPPELRAKLGETVTLGELEITPVEIVERRLKVETEGTDGEKRTDWLGNALVLTLSITNKSADLVLHPMDPAFTRKAVGNDRPITRLVVSKGTVFAGGAIPWPPGERVKKKLEAQQVNDSLPLGPNERHEYVVFTDANPEVVKAVRSADGPVQWRVQVRRGPVEYRGKEVPVTAVIGVDFTASDVKTLG